MTVYIIVHALSYEFISVHKTREAAEKAARKSALRLLVLEQELEE